MSSKTTVVLPREISIKTIDSILEPIIDGKMECEYDIVSFDFREIEWIEPTGITVLTNLFEWLSQEDVRLLYKRKSVDESFGRHYRAMKYLEDSGFFDLYGFAPFSNSGGELRSTTLPLRKIEYRNYAQWNETEFVHWMQKQTGRQSPFTNVQVAVQEIFNNISDHSKVNTGCVFAQFYPQSDLINISFSDFGIGIPNSIRNQNPSLTDCDLLEFAVKEGVSTQSVPGNRGAGLWNVVRNLTNANIGEVHICSNYGRIWYNDKEVRLKHESEVYYPGTFFEIKLHIGNEDLYEDEEEEVFEWL